MGSIDVKRRGSEFPTGYFLAVQSTCSVASQTAAANICLPNYPPSDVYKIRGFDIQFAAMGTATGTTCVIKVGMMPLANNNTIETGAILAGQTAATGFAFSPVSSALPQIYRCRKAPPASGAHDSPYNIMRGYSGSMVGSLPTTNTTTAAGSAFVSSTAYDFHFGAGGDTFSLLATDARVKGVNTNHIGCVPAVMVTQAANSDAVFQATPMIFTVYYEVVSVIGNI